MSLFFFFSLQHLPDEEPRKVPERPLTKRMRSTRKKTAYNPFVLVPCQSFPSSNEYPFTVIFHSEALIVIDIHSHLSTTEVIGLLGGTYCVTERVLKVRLFNRFTQYYSPLNLAKTNTPIAHCSDK